jgi:hypothetical protein
MPIVKVSSKHRNGGIRPRSPEPPVIGSTGPHRFPSSTRLPRRCTMRARFLLDHLLHRQTTADFFYPLDPLGNLHGALGLCRAGSNTA